jgi:orotate phosphoribosyltransferase
MMDERDRAELLEIIRKQSFQTEGAPYVLASGKTSDYYLDCKMTTLSHPRGRELSCQIIYDIVRKMKPRPEAIGGLSIGAVPLSLGVSDRALDDDPRWILPAFVVRDEQKSHGTRKIVEGTIQPGSGVVVVDDVMTTGGSVMKAIRAAENQGARIEKVIILVDREEGGRDTLAGYDVVTLFTVSDLRAM